jgi:hypothetical protein
LQKKLLNAFPENDHIKIERSITLGNALLDFSKFRMLREAQHIAKECEHLLLANPQLEGLKIGYAALLRNFSILYAELGQLKQGEYLVSALRALVLNNPQIMPLKEEMARALANSITSQLAQKPGTPDRQKTAHHFNILEDLYQHYPDNQKIKGAFAVSKANLEKAGS